MDGGQFRTPRQAGRGVVNGSESTPLPYRQPELPPAPAREVQAEIPVPAPQPIISTPRPLESKPKKTNKKSVNKLIFGIATGLIIVLVGIAVWFFAASPRVVTDQGIDKNKYQAVFFTNGLVYYGKLSSVDTRYLKLTDIYYIQSQSSNATQNDTKVSSDTTQSKLIKMGSEVYGPEDEAIIARDQVLYYTNLKSDSKVVQLIKNYEK